MSNTFKIFCVFISLAVSMIPAFGQSTAIPANNQPLTNPAAPDSAKIDLLQSELSSAPLAPCVLVGTSSFIQSATSGDSTIWVDITTKPPTLHGTTTVPVTSVISWGSGSCTTATTCTIVFQNAPRVPLWYPLKVQQRQLGLMLLPQPLWSTKHRRQSHRQRQRQRQVGFQQPHRTRSLLRCNWQR